MAIKAVKLLYEKNGDPKQVLQVLDNDQQEQSPGHGQVAIDIIYSPVNPSDEMTVSGVYPLQPPKPAIGGNEGVGRIVAVGPGVTDMKPGDIVIAVHAGQGCWRTRGIYEAKHWHVIPSDVPKQMAATILVNYTTALEMLSTFVDLQPGDVVVQNGANSNLGQVVIQLARSKGIKTVNVIRDRADWDDAVSFLSDLGADLVTTAEKLPEAMKEKNIPAARLALNCVNGFSGEQLLSVLGPGGHHVTYGALQQEPIKVPFHRLLFDDVKVVGFWLSGRASKNQTLEQRKKLVDELCDHIQKGDLRRTKYNEIPGEKVKEALDAAHQSNHQKVLLKFNEE